MDAAFGWFTAAFSLGQMGGPLLAGIAMGTASSVSAATRLSDANTALLAASVISLAAVPFGFGAAVRKERRTTHEAPAARPPSALAILGIREVRINIVASLALLTMTDILVAFLPLLGEELGVAPAVVGVLLAVRAAASISSRLMLGVLLRRWRRTRLVIASLAGAALTLAPLPWIFDLPVLAGAMLAVGGFFLGLGQPVTMTLVTQAVPASSRGAALALRLLGNRVGQVILPAAAGLVAAPLGPGGAIWMSCAVLGAACIRWPRAGEDGGGPGEDGSPGLAGS
jgi:predicted MFS family arabinose efflux permease